MNSDEEPEPPKKESEPPKKEPEPLLKGESWGFEKVIQGLYPEGKDLTIR